MCYLTCAGVFLYFSATSLTLGSSTKSGSPFGALQLKFLRFNKLTNVLQFSHTYLYFLKRCTKYTWRLTSRRLFGYAKMLHSAAQFYGGKIRMYQIVQKYLQGLCCSCFPQNKYIDILLCILRWSNKQNIAIEFPCIDLHKESVHTTDDRQNQEGCML